MKSCFIKKLQEDLKLPQESKLDISKRNLKILKTVISILSIFGIFGFCACLINKNEFLRFYLYYASYPVGSLILFLAMLFTKKRNNYLVNQTIVIIAIINALLLSIFGLYYATIQFASLIIFYIICLLAVIFFEVTPFFYLISITLYEIFFLIEARSLGFEMSIVANSIIYCTLVILLSFYKRILTAKNEKQRIQIEEQSRLLEANNIELSRQKDSLIVNKKHLEDTVFNQSQELQLQNERIIRIQNNTITSLSNLVENRDADTGEHVQRTRDYVGLIATKALLSGKFPELNEEVINLYYKAAPMHDIGKIVVPDAILKKEGKLTPEEFEIIKIHTTKGGKIVEDVLGAAEDEDYVKTAKEIATYHHEKWNGQGYPEGLKGEEIPLSARIMAVADVFDALVSPRCYKEPFPVEKAFSIIQESSGSHFDPDLAEIFIQAKDEVIEILNKYQ